ncbi:hypothetical protein MES4922_40216 [Mesorhizobium ventifaucium]|uniref:Uncharacterized protein n=1 Tax=Mesorhizobium ventifaucium TaxID=666020 RepID=A0ABM9E8A7_9HYPH|nr:hypothetical protein MES4922_40216 [Mesorhizobium ventifaucium]
MSFFEAFGCAFLTVFINCLGVISGVTTLLSHDRSDGAVFGPIPVRQLSRTALLERFRF